MTVEVGTRIERPPADVFAALVDPATHLRWRPSAVEFRTRDGARVRAGSELVEVVRFAGRRFRSVYRVTKLRPERLLELRTLEGPVALTLRCELEPWGSGTRLRFVLDAEPAGLFRLAPRLFDLVMTRDLRREARMLKEMLESNGSS